MVLEAGLPVARQCLSGLYRLRMYANVSLHITAWMPTYADQICFINVRKEVVKKRSSLSPLVGDIPTD